MLMRRQQAVCPHCGQRMLVRHGVRLSPLLADLFDMIERSGEAGITSEVLCGVFWPGRGRDSLKSNISHLNTRLVETDYEVRAGPGRHNPFYRVRLRT